MIYFASYFLTRKIKTICIFSEILDVPADFDDQKSGFINKSWGGGPQIGGCTIFDLIIYLLLNITFLYKISSKSLFKRRDWWMWETLFCSASNQSRIWTRKDSIKIPSTDTLVKKSLEIFQLFSYKILDRFNYFIRECLFSGLLSNGTQVDRVLVKDNCKTDKYHVQLLSKYGRRDGHFMMFESMGIQERLKAKCFSLSIEF